MNAEQLLTHFDRIANAPDAIPRLRRFILDLAVHGKLVPQDPNDEPTLKLLERITRAKTASELKQIRERGKTVDPLLTELFFPLPAGWSSACLSDLVEVLNGRAYKKSELLEHGTPVLRVGNLFTSNHWYYSNLVLDENKYCEEGDLIYAWSASFGPFIWRGPRAIFHYHIWKISFFSEDDLNKKFLYFFLLQKTREIKEAGHGVSMAHMTKEKMEQLVIPIPPLSEQHRIVAKVDELMALCDQLETSRTEREATRDRMATASLARLNTPDPDPATFQSHAAFALNNLTSLTTRPDQIKALRQTILNLAVRGKLVPQDPNDEPASELLKRIAKDFSRQVAEGKLNKPKPVKPLSTKEELFSLPPGWTEARFNEVAAIQSNLVDPKRYTALPHIAPDNIESWTARLLSYVSVGEAGVHSGKHLFSAGAILYSKIRPNLAKVAKVNFDGLCSADMYPIHPLIDRDFLVKFMITKDFVAQAVKEDNRVAMPKINQSALSDIVVLVPPLAEQHRIVEKVDELMNLCDQLEASLATGEKTLRRLVESTLHQALEPNEPC